MILNKPYFITTPIFYVNAAPHIGHVHSALVADAQARFQKLRTKRDPLFSTGTDEHGLKIQQAAEKFQQSPFDYASAVSMSYQSLFKRLRLCHSDFIRTTEGRHRSAVHALWNTIHEGDHIVKRAHEGWYCVQDETFLTENQLVTKADGLKVSAESGHPVEWCTEENYVFKLSNFSQKILNYLDKDESVIRPKVFRNHLNSFFENGLPDISVSRPSSRLKWGIPVPNDPSQTIYVWLDALTNYLTVAGYPDHLKNWPPSCHVIGKDILKFHAIYWPGFLMAAGLDPPESILCHSHWMVGDEKMSKSKGNVIDPNMLMDQVSEEGLRYFLLREGTPHSDGNFSDKKMRNYLDSELANTLGNLLSRVSKGTILESQQFPAGVDSNHCSQLALDLMDQAERLPSTAAQHFSDFNYHLGVDAIMQLLRDCNGFIQEEKPWELKKSDRERLQTVLLLALECLRVSGILLQPIVPHLTDLLLTKLGVPADQRHWENAESFAWKSNMQQFKLSSQKVILFRRTK